MTYYWYYYYYYYYYYLLLNLGYFSIAVQGKLKQNFLILNYLKFIFTFNKWPQINEL